MPIHYWNCWAPKRKETKKSLAYPFVHAYNVFIYALRQITLGGTHGTGDASYLRTGHR